MAEILLVLEAYALIEQVNSIYDSARDRIEKTSHNPQLARKLSDLFKQLKMELAPLVEQCDNNEVNFSEHQMDVFNNRISELRITMQHIQENLAKKIEKLSNRYYRFIRARTTNDWLSEVESAALGAADLILVITACFASAGLVAKNANAIQKVQETVEQGTMDVLVALNATTDATEDTFQPSFDEVPENPPHVVLKFDSISDIDEPNRVSLTVEAKLKRAVLRSIGTRTVAAVGSRLGVMGVRGMSGVGKSCALRGLAKDTEVRGHFHDGIYFIVLGKDVTDADVMQGISTIMNRSGSNRLAKEVREDKEIDKAVSKAREWFKGKCILLEIDDVWEESDTRRDIVGRLSNIADMTAGSRVVFSTRDERMAARSEVIRFGERGEEESRGILLSAAGLQDTDVAGCEGILDDVLGYCGGIPMALAVAGSGVNMRLKSNSVLSVSDVLQEYVGGLRSFRQRLVRRTVDNDPYKNLESTFRASLEMLERSRGQRLPFICQMSFLEMYRALVVIRRQGWIPVTILQGLWGMRDIYEAMDVMDELVLVSLAQREDRIVKGEKVAGIALHDLHLDFVEGQMKDGELEMWHRKVLGIWSWEEEGSSGSEGVSGNGDWCRVEILRDEYVRDNLGRHLMGAGRHVELYGLLKNPEWTAKMLCGGEVMSLEKDIRMLMEYLERKEGKSTQTESAIWTLKMIAGAARLSAPYVSRNGSEVWFQLYGRLFRLAEKSEALRSYIAGIERCAQRPWLKAFLGCLVEPGGPLQSKMLCEGGVRCLSETDRDGKYVTCGLNGGGGAFVSTFVRCLEQSTVWISIEDATVHSDDVLVSDEWSSATGSKSSPSRISSVVTAINCSRDGSRVVTGHGDGRLHTWEAKTGRMIGKALVGHSDLVSCVAWSPDCKWVASGGADNTVRIWDVEKGEAAGEPLVGHKDQINSVAWSPEGKRVASGGDDCSVRVWGVGKGEAIWEALEGHKGFVKCVAWSPDGRQIASAGLDGTVRIWEVEKRVAVGKPLVGHGHWVTCIAWSPDGKQIVSGGDDDMVRVWKVEEGKAVEEPLVGHGYCVMSVAWSPDGRRIVSGGLDGTVCLWLVDIGESVGKAPARHSDWVRCVAWSPDGKRVASGGRDGTVRVWDVDKGEATGEALVGHSGLVLCLAWSADGKRIASGGRDGTVRVWVVESEKCVWSEDGWVFGDLSRLNFLLGKENVSPGDDCKEKIAVVDGSVVYSSGGKDIVLGTLEDPFCWEYLEACRSIVVGGRKGAIFGLRLIE